MPVAVCLTEDAMPEVTLPVLLLEPEMSGQLALLDALHDAHAPIEVECVSTCGGAHHALQLREFAGLLLSTSLCLHDAECRDLAALWQRAHLRGIAVLSVSPAGLQVTPELLGVPLHESLAHDDVASGRLHGALERAYARARMDQVLEVFARHDRAALTGRASLGLARELSTWLEGTQRELTTTRDAGGVVGRLRRRLEEPLAAASLLSDGVPAGNLRALRQLVTVRVEDVLDRATGIASAIAATRVTTRRDYGRTPDLAVEEAAVCQLLVNLLLALLGSAPSSAEWVLSTRATERDAIVELVNPKLRLDTTRLASLFDPFGATDGFVSGIGLWAGRQLLGRWGIEVTTIPSPGTAFRVTFPARLRSRSQPPSH